jgi:hypothetical protein
MSTEKELQIRASDLMQASRGARDPERKRRLIAEALAVAQEAEAMKRRKGAFAPNTGPEAVPMSYTLYLVTDGRFSDARNFVAGSDEAALAVACAVQDACSDLFQSFELWQRSRQIVGKAWPRPEPLRADVAEESQARVLELEESLLSSRRALAESEKLIRATDELRNKLQPRGY